MSYNISLFFLHRGNFGFFKRMGVNHLCKKISLNSRANYLYTDSGYTQSYAIVSGLKGLTWKKQFAQNFL